MSTGTPATLTVPEAARVLGLGRNSVYQAIERGEVPAIRIGRRLIVPVEALERFLARAARVVGEPGDGGRGEALGGVR